ncbi:MAG TPA: molybdopterin-binding protein [Methylibium sp.]|uniref:competence/damage-inducible protein A n=1 Tax=Methylibium sp. TaxID=2067992 RepID=UPI002DBBDA7F|nr:molybdopterin-binding protein [Methylibium sp.]HEU4460298.1 molybdopterin-binding protein [Methylibium sp.]
MNFGLIIVGDEILSGKRADAHLAKTIALLGERGLALSWARYVGDERERIAATLREAFASGDAVFSCGGIGATPDDHTRQAAAAALGVPLVLHPLAKERIVERMREVAAEQGTSYDADRPDNVHRLNMGVFPQGAEIIENPYNKIPGFTCASPTSRGAVHFLPGFPVMAWPMMAAVLDTRYADRHGQARTRERSVVVYGAAEAALTPLMEAIEARFAGLKVFSLPSVDHPQHGRHVELGVKGGEAAQVEQGFAALLEGLRAAEAKLGPTMVRGATT